MNLPCCLETANWLEWLTHTKSLPNIYRCCLSVIPLMSVARSLSAFVAQGEEDEWSLWKVWPQKQVTRTLHKAGCFVWITAHSVKRLQGWLVSASWYVESGPGGVVQFPWIPERYVKLAWNFTPYKLFFTLCARKSANKFLAYGLCRL